MKKTVSFLLVLGLLGTTGVTGLTWDQKGVIKAVPAERSKDPTGGKLVLPPSPYKVVFLTSQVYDGNLGGLAGADAKCQQLANAAGLKGTYKAWLSDSKRNCPATRFTRSIYPYKLVNGKTVAKNWQELTKGSIATPINIIETGATVQHYNNFVWTGTNPDGTPGTPPTYLVDRYCSDWTTKGDYTGPFGLVGNKIEVNVAWSLGSIYDAEKCLGRHPLYCFQQ